MMAVKLVKPTELQNVSERSKIYRHSQVNKDIIQKIKAKKMKQSEVFTPFLALNSQDSALLSELSFGLW